MQKKGRGAGFSAKKKKTEEITRSLGKREFGLGKKR